MKQEQDTQEDDGDGSSGSSYTFTKPSSSEGGGTESGRASPERASGEAAREVPTSGEEAWNQGRITVTLARNSPEKESGAQSHRHFASEPTKWTIADVPIPPPSGPSCSICRLYISSDAEGTSGEPNWQLCFAYQKQESEMTDPLYIRDDTKTDFEPLPRADSDYRIAVDSRIEEHFIGIRSSEEASKLVKLDDFALYYKVDQSSDVSAAIPLFLVHKNTRNEVFHFPVLRTSEDNGMKWWHVQIGDNKMQSFRQLSDLVRTYHLYRFTDASSGRMEVFPLWQGGVVDHYE